MKLYRGLSLDKAEIDFIRSNGGKERDKVAWLLKPLIDHHNEEVAKFIRKLGAEDNEVQRYNRTSNELNIVGKYVTGCKLGAAI